MTTMPAEVVHGKVVGRFLLAVADTSDPDRLPDARPATGQIVFTPTVPNMKTSAPDLATVIKVPIRCTIDANGYLVDPEGGEGVWLVAGIYRVTYALTGVTIGSHVIEVFTEHSDETPLDLTNALPPSGPGISPSQYTEIMGRLDSLPTSVNGMTGTVLLTADDVNAYTKEEADSRFLTEAEIPGAPVLSVNGETGNVVVDIPVTSVNGETGDVTVEIPPAPVTSVNGKVGAVNLTAGDVGALTPEEGDLRYSSTGSSSYKGAWNSNVAYEAGDMVTISEILWAATTESSNVLPSVDVQINPAGGDGGPGSYPMQSMFGSPVEYLHPIRLTRDVLVGSISLLVHTDPGMKLHAGKIGITAIRPEPGTSVPPQLISPATSFAEELGSGWHEIVLDDPVSLNGETNYWVVVAMGAGGFGNLNGHFPGYVSYTSPMKAPTDSNVRFRYTTSEQWQSHDRRSYVRLGEYEPPAWEALADLTPAPASVRTGIAWMTVVDPATDIRPDADHVIWNGGDTKPVNMAVDDIWIKA